ncbi:MAG: PIN domain protein [Candidatus Brocadia sp.]|uniref:PIN domain protein n=1 Tax=Candidatus Brocadia fulgida TaxID=380242 RepID=A0A0M2UQ34_9BACT|nr:MAG: hypothetical protein BROFUL_03096 [Candidatus Brocadia fulgida]MCE7910866.1 PIN domain protein [Candidatus Brocadia sp. AMX3]MDG5996718.1 PIN domain protein [Candidatus Brocadia sp.]MBV6517530.1 hypothetical protein [Candidatus Brocadia fulgida]RIK01918.1 MAG: PIN domain protein [Candidatus Brocadia sp.]
MKIYLDNCCFNRPFDDQSQLRIRLETEAKLKIQEEVRAGKLKWSYILDYENSKNPYEERKFRIRGWAKYALINIKENAEIIKRTNLLNQKGFRKLDSLHIACAITAKCDHFLSTDDKILSLSKTLEGKIKVTDPIVFIKEVLS